MGWLLSLLRRAPPLAPPGVLDRVLIVRAPEGYAALRNQSGRIEMITDGQTTFVRLDNGASVTLDISCLERI